HWNAALAENTERGGNPERVVVVRATANIFSLYGTSPLLGRVFTADEDRPGGPNVAVVTYRLWDRRFGRDPALIGRTIRLDGLPYTVIGITPRRFQEWGADIYLPLDLDPALANRSKRSRLVAGIMNKGFSAEQTEPVLRDLPRRGESQYRATNPEYGGAADGPLELQE